MSAHPLQRVDAPTSDSPVADRATPAQIIKSIDNSDRAALRRLGVYTQRPAESGFHMVRIRIPGGDITSDQLRSIASIADRHGRGVADVTVRQNIQLHWISSESLFQVISEIEGAGFLTTEPSAGVRNIVNCPVSGVDEHELYDTTEIVRQVNQFFANSRDFSDLPRKFKVAITGCALRCVYPEIQDIGIFAVRDRGRVMFRARVGGGLSDQPRFSRDLGVVVPPEDVVALCVAIATVFRDQAREDNSRVSYVVQESQIKDFRERVEQVLGSSLERASKPEAEPLEERDRSHLGIHGQRTKIEPSTGQELNGIYYVGLSLIGGRTSGADLTRLAALAERFGSGCLRTTNTQNLILLDVPERNLQQLCFELDRGGFNFEPTWSEKGVIACSGTQFCRLALAETKNRAAELSEFLYNTVDLDEPLRISVTGCPNSCGQHRICDIGLEGSSTVIDGVKRETFQVYLGGGVGTQEVLNRKLGIRVPAEELAEAMARLFTRYKEQRLEGENFQEFCSRHTEAELSSFVIENESEHTGIHSQREDLRLSFWC